MPRFPSSTHNCYHAFMQYPKSRLSSIASLLALLVFLVIPVHGQVDQAEDWEQRCLDKILKNYSGPSLAEGPRNLSIQFTIFPDGTAKWPNSGNSASETAPLNTIQKEKLKALKTAILKSSPFEKFPEYLSQKRAVAEIAFRDDDKPYFQVIDYPGSWTAKIYQSTKPEQWKEILDPISKNFVVPQHMKQVHACVYLVIAPDGKILDNYPTRCTRVKCQTKELYSEVVAAQKALVSAIKQSSPFSMGRLCGEEPEPIAAYVIYRSYEKPQLQLYSAHYGRCFDYIDLYEHGEKPPGGTKVP